MKTKRNKPAAMKIRGEVRSKWDMPHKSKVAYDRKQENKFEIEDEDISSSSPQNEPDDEQIECSFRPLREYTCLPPSGSEDEKTKLGRYHRSSFPGHSGFHTIGAHIGIDFKPWLSAGLNEQQIFTRCINYLNRKSPRKKKSPYGSLIPRSASFKEDDKGTFISAILTTDDPKNTNFWKK